jgi:ketosteroid isomerase-like protein
MTTTPATATALVRTYFTAAVAADQEPYVALFAPDATVEDEGRSFTGRQAVREWRRDVPDVTYAPGEVVADADGWAVRATVAGDFPGSPVELGYWFCFDDQDLVAQLRIRP